MSNTANGPNPTPVAESQQSKQPVNANGNSNEGPEIQPTVPAPSAPPAASNERRGFRKKANDLMTYGIVSDRSIVEQVYDKIKAKVRKRRQNGEDQGPPSGQQQSPTGAGSHNDDRAAAAQGGEAA